MSIEYKCAHCGRTIEEGEFLALVGTAPAAGLSAPIGRADKLFDDIGRLYDAACLQQIGAEGLVAIAEGGETAGE